jgi:nucleotide-binding universal stress UspA family protein
VLDERAPFTIYASRRSIEAEVGMYKTIVVGATKSETARRATEEAIELARSLDADLHLVAAYPKDEGPIDGKDTPGRVDAERTLNAMIPHGTPGKCTTHALPGDPAEAILLIAREVNADLIVVGNKRMQGAARLLGSVPNDIAHRAPCAVLIAKTT